MIVALMAAAGLVFVTAGVTVILGGGFGLVAAGLCLLSGAYLTEKALSVGEGDE